VEKVGGGGKELRVKSAKCKVKNEMKGKAKEGRNEGTRKDHETTCFLLS
jgi:hypothetical protein